MENVTLKVQVGNVSVEVTGEPDYAEKKLMELMEKYTGFKMSESKGPAVIAAAAIKGGKTLAPNEFIRKINPKSQVDRGLALAYYLEKYAAQESFTTAELVDVCAKAKQQSFTNVSDVVGQLVSKGFLMGAGDKEGKRAYSLTTTGEEQFETMFAKQD